jgi:hypothetical protein
MKTSPFARRYLRTRLILLCLSVAVVAALEVGFSKPVAVRISQTAGVAAGVSSAPRIGMSDVMAAAATVH